MQKTILLPFIIIAAVAIGGLLYLYGGPAFHRTYSDVQHPSTLIPGGKQQMTVLAQGSDAGSVDQRVNYRILNQDQLVSVWQTIYTDSGRSVPTIDFSKYEVLAIFDGSHTLDGFSVRIESVQDTADARVVTIVHGEPGDSCVPGGEGSSPYVLVQVPKSSLPISRLDQRSVTQCP